MRRGITITTLSLVVAFFVAANAMAGEWRKMVVTMASANPPGSQHAVALEAFKEYVERETNGTIECRLFLSGSMGDEQTNVKQLRNNELQVASVFTGNMTPSAAIMNVLVLPYLFSSMDDAAALLSNKEFTDKIADIAVTQSRVRPMGWILGGFRHITNSKHRVRNNSELQGLKIRVSPTPTQLEAFRAFGIEPHPMAWAEVFNALQQGVVDGQENPFFAIRDNKFWEVQKYVTELHYMLWTGPICVSEVWFSRLDDAHKDLVRRAMAYAQDREWKWIVDVEDECKRLAIEHGMTVDVLEDEPAWQEKARSIWPKFYSLIGDTAIIDEAVAIIDASRKKQ